MAETTEASMAHWPRTRKRRSRTTGYSRFVGIAKLLLLALAGGLIILLVVWSEINLDETRLRIGTTDFAAEDVDTLNMVNPRFEGIDDRNRPFSVTADRAVQADEEGRIIELARPKADITLSDGTWLALTADRGEYDRDTEMLRLSGSVTLLHDDGFKLRTSRARIDMKAGVATGDAEIHGQGPSGKLVADGFRVSDDGNRIVLTGNSRLVLHPDKAEAGE